MSRSSGHLDLNRASEGCINTYPNHKNGNRREIGKAPPWNGDRHVRQAQSTVPTKQGENILRGPGKYTEATENRLKGEETYDDIDGESDVIRLLLLIKSISYSYESKSYPVLAIHMTPRKLYLRYQSSSSSLS